MRNSHLIAVLLALSASLAGCANPPPPPVAIATVTPGDNQLSCADLSSQMAQMDQIMAARTDTGVSALTFVPVVGSIATLSNMNNNIASVQNQAYQKSQAAQRKQRLLQLYTDHKC